MHFQASTILSLATLLASSLSVSALPAADAAAANVFDKRTSCPAQCIPFPEQNKCDSSTSCVVTYKDPPSSNPPKYCACRAGYRADGLSPNDPQQRRLTWPGQEGRVFVAPGVKCNTLCNQWQLGKDGCKEVPEVPGCL